MAASEHSVPYATQLSPANEHSPARVFFVTLPKTHTSWMQHQNSWAWSPSKRFHLVRETKSLPMASKLKHHEIKSPQLLQPQLLLLVLTTLSVADSHMKNASLLAWSIQVDSYHFDRECLGLVQVALLSPTLQPTTVEISQPTAGCQAVSQLQPLKSMFQLVEDTVALLCKRGVRKAEGSDFNEHLPNLSRLSPSKWDLAIQEHNRYQWCNFKKPKVPDPYWQRVGGLVQTNAWSGWKWRYPTTTNLHWNLRLVLESQKEFLT